jgi:hypothetical protein
LPSGIHFLRIEYVVAAAGSGHQRNGYVEGDYKVLIIMGPSWRWLFIPLSFDNTVTMQMKAVAPVDFPHQELETVLWRRTLDWWKETLSICAY